MLTPARMNGSLWLPILPDPDPVSPLRKQAQPLTCYSEALSFPIEDLLGSTRVGMNGIAVLCAYGSRCTALYLYSVPATSPLF